MIASSENSGAVRSHRTASLDPRTKVVIALLFVLTVALLPYRAFAAYALMLLFLWSAAAYSRINFAYLLKRSLIAIPFALAAVTLPFTLPGKTLLELPALNITMTLEGTLRFTAILLKSWLSVQMAALLVLLVPLPDLLWALRALRVPKTLVAIVNLMIRYLTVLADEAGRMMRARAARSAGPRGGSKASIVWRGKTTGQMAGTLMLRSLERSERVYSAMLARGYSGEMRAVADYRMRRIDRILLAGAIAFYVLVLIFSLTV